MNEIRENKTSRKFVVSPMEEIFDDLHLMLVNASAFVTGRPLTPHTC